jgi:hypothetical protein
VNFDEATDRLYGADLDDFVAERTRLARELRDAGDRTGSAQVVKLKKPTLAAWALNQLSRRRRRDVDLLLDTGHRLRQAQEGVVQGADRASFEQAQKTQRDALRRLTQEAGTLLGGASPAILGQISNTLRAAAVSEAGRELLARGRFTTPLESEGFDVLGALPRSGAARPKKREPAKKAKDELLKLRARLRELEKEVRAAERKAEKSKADLKDSERAAESARAALESAQRDVTRAERRAGR